MASDGEALTREAKLREACMQGSTKQVKLMIKRGADVRAADEEGFTPMHSAAVSGSAKLVKLLAEAGAMPDTPDTYGDTPLLYAAIGGHVHAVHILLELGADPHHRGEDGHTVIQAAKNVNQTEVVKYFQKYKVDKSLGALDLSGGVSFEDAANLGFHGPHGKFERFIIVMSEPHRAFFFWKGRRKYPKGAVQRIAVSTIVSVKHCRVPTHGWQFKLSNGKSVVVMGQRSSEVERWVTGMRHIGGTKMAAHIIARFFKSREAMHKLDVLITKFRALMRSVNRTAQHKEGLLRKRNRTGVGMGRAAWRRRYFVLSSKDGALTYHASEAEMKRHPKKGRKVLFTTLVNAEALSDPPFTFQVRIVGGRALVLQASSDEERDSWLEALAKVNPRTGVSAVRIQTVWRRYSAMTYAIPRRRHAIAVAALEQKYALHGYVMSNMARRIQKAAWKHKLISERRKKSKVKVSKVKVKVDSTLATATRTRSKRLSVLLSKRGRGGRSALPATGSVAEGAGAGAGSGAGAGASGTASGAGRGGGRRAGRRSSVARLASLRARTTALNERRAAATSSGADLAPINEGSDGGTEEGAEAGAAGTGTRTAASGSFGDETGSDGGTGFSAGGTTGTGVGDASSTEYTLDDGASSLLSAGQFSSASGIGHGGGSGVRRFSGPGVAAGDVVAVTLNMLGLTGNSAALMKEPLEVLKSLEDIMKLDMLRCMLGDEDVDLGDLGTSELHELLRLDTRQVVARWAGWASTRLDARTRQAAALQRDRAMDTLSGGAGEGKAGDGAGDGTHGGGGSDGDSGGDSGSGSDSDSDSGSDGSDSDDSASSEDDSEWVAALDPRSGRRYWCQPATGLSSWSRPEGYTTPSDSSGSDSDSSGSDSGSESDSSEGDNGDSKVRPKRVDNASDGNSTSGSSSGSGSDSNDDDDDDVWVPVTPAEKEAKAAGWVRAKDASGEKYYWANPKTGESSWVKPWTR